MYNRRFPFHHTPASGKRLDFIRIMIAIIAEKLSRVMITSLLSMQSYCFFFMVCYWLDLP